MGGEKRRRHEREEPEDEPSDGVREALHGRTHVDRQALLRPHLVVGLAREVGSHVEHRDRQHVDQQDAVSRAGDHHADGLKQPADDEHEIPPPRVHETDEDDHDEQAEQREQRAEARGEGLARSARVHQEVRLELAERVRHQAPEDVEDHRQDGRDEEGLLPEHITQPDRGGRGDRGDRVLRSSTRDVALERTQPGVEPSDGPGDDRHDGELTEDDPDPHHLQVGEEERESLRDRDAGGPHDLRHDHQPALGTGGRALGHHRHGGREIGPRRRASDDHSHEEHDLIDRGRHERHPDGVDEDVDREDAHATEAIGDPPSEEGSDGDGERQAGAERADLPRVQLEVLLDEHEPDAEADDDGGVEVGRHPRGDGEEPVPTVGPAPLEERLDGWRRGIVHH